MIHRSAGAALAGLLAQCLACSAPPVDDFADRQPQPQEEEPEEPAGVEAKKSAADPATSSAKPALTATLTGNGSGAITSAPSGVTCTGTTCTGSFAQSTKVTLTAKPSPGAFFVGWKGACTGTDTCVVDIQGTIDVEAEFSGLDGTTWTGKYSGQKKVGSCFANNAGDITVKFTKKGEALSSKVDLGGIDMRDTAVCSTSGTTSGSSSESPLQITGATLFGTWDVAASGPTSTFSYPFMAQISGNTIKGSWRCVTCPGDFTLTKQ